ncbi:PilZ domain-containing protein [Sporolactobacillus laevolacticus]|uniref:PilZ domain-containing protein n=1 Tax=Sporolactobacillus laevolacticus TaxID=33018 RepID=UPI0025B36050|nr:PilZ domain-containing protein [Sporolactobacillus laevolacticus]MDN3956533.1 PilZ domain-containing protein [Sporolactobacillus laevolacticus]
MSEYLVIALGAGFEVILVLVVLFAFMLHYKAILNKDRRIIKTLRQKLSNEHNLVAVAESTERRRHHRLKLDGEKCTVRIIDFGEHTLQRLNNKSFEVEMLDISLGGMKISCSIDFPVREEVDVVLSFTKEDGTVIHVKGLVMRKETKHGRRTVNYGIQFINPSAKEETEIQSYINQKEIAKKSLNSAAVR